MVETTTQNYGWTKPEPGHSATTWGTFLNSDLDSIDSHMWTINTQVQLNTLSVQRAADGGAVGAVEFNNNGGSQPRWIMYETSESETGGNAGSNFSLVAFSDSGAYLGTAFSIARATQVVTFAQGVIMNGALTVSGTLTASSIAGNPTFSGIPTFSGSINVNGNVTANGATFNGYINANGGGYFGGTTSMSTVAMTTGTITNLTVNSNAYFGAANASTNFNISANSSYHFIQFSPQWTLNWQTNNGLLFWSTPAGAVVQIDGSGNISYAGSLIHISDAAVKENIALFEDDSLAIVNGIPVKSYNLIGKPRRELGFIAQDVGAMLPEAVSPTKDGVLGIAQEPLVAVLWRAVQELTKRVEELEAQFSP